MKNHGYHYWTIAVIFGSLINMGVFLILPALGKTEKPTPPQIIELEFMALQPPTVKKIQPQKKQPPKAKKLPKPKPKPIPKPIPKKIKPIPKPKLRPAPEPVLSEKITPKKITPVTPPKETIEGPVEPPPPITPVHTDTDAREDSLPTPVPIFQLTQLPRMIHRQKPVYPPAMRQQGKEATVKLEILLDTKGKIRKITVKKSAGNAFDQAAVAAIKNSTFMPANIKGKPVSVLMKIPVKFRLR